MTPLHIALALSTVAPEIVKWITGGGTKADQVVSTVANTVQELTGRTGAEAVEAIRADPALLLQFRTRVVELDAQLQEAELKDRQAEHREQQETIRNGDDAEDPYVRHTRPLVARQSWYGMALYIAAFEGLKVFDKGQGASLELAMLIASPVLAYIGFRSMFDKGAITSRLGGLLGRK